MKKLTRRYRNWLIYRSRKSDAQRSGRRPKFGQLTTNAGIQLVQLTAGKTIPNNLCLDTALRETLTFFFQLRAKTVNRGFPTFKSQPMNIGWIRGYTDFTTLRRISPGAALILAAEYDRIYRYGNIPALAIDLHHWDDNVYSTLFQLGFFNLLGLQAGQARLPTPVDTTVLQAPMVRGIDTNWQEAGSTLLDLFEKVGGDQSLRVNLLGAIVDAIENVRGHAYGGRNQLQEKLIPPFWWLSGAADTVNRRLTLAIYDQGNTIPVTLPKVWPAQQISDAFVRLFGRKVEHARSENDREALEVAMRLSSTSTHKSERGKGLSKIRHVVSECSGGRLRVVSRRGNYEYRDGFDAYMLNDIPLLGTYIEIEATF